MLRGTVRNSYTRSDRESGCKSGCKSGCGSVSAPRVGVALLAALALAAPFVSACSHLERDIEYSLAPVRPHVAHGERVKVEVVDISSRGGDDYLVVRLRIENRGDDVIAVDPLALRLVIGDQVKATHALAEERRRARGGGRTGDDDDSDDDDSDDGDDGDWDDDEPRSASPPSRPEREDIDGDEEDERGALSALNPEIIGGAIGDAVKEGAKGGAEAAGGVAKEVGAVGYVAVKGTVIAIKGAVKGSTLLVKGVHDAIDRGIHKRRSRVAPGAATEIAIKFDGVASERGLLPSYLPSYLFFDDVLSAGDDVLSVAPLLVTNPQETHLGYAPPNRARLALGLRAGGGGTIETDDAAPVGAFFGLQGFLGPRIGPWSFTATGTVGAGFMLGFDARRDVVNTERFLATAYLGYGRYWLLEADTEDTTLVSGRGPRVGVDFLFAFTRKTLDWRVTTGGLGVYVEVAPLWFDDGDGVHIAGGVSFLGY